MFSNTGTLSFWLYMVIIAITAVASWLIVRLIIKSADDTKTASITEIFKYFIGSVCLVAVPAIILNFLNERDQDLEELKYFDTHTSTIILADGEGRYQLARYFSNVAPEGELKDGWKDYYDMIKGEHETYLAAKSEKERIDSMAVLSREENRRLEMLNETIKRYETPILTPEQYKALRDEPKK